MKKHKTNNTDKLINVMCDLSTKDFYKFYEFWFGAGKAFEDFRDSLNLYEDNDKDVLNAIKFIKKLGYDI